MADLRMTPEELAQFRAHPWAEDALKLRQCDDGGKNTSYAVQNAAKFIVSAPLIDGTRS